MHFMAKVMDMFEIDPYRVANGGDLRCDRCYVHLGVGYTVFGSSHTLPRRFNFLVGGVASQLKIGGGR